MHARPIALTLLILGVCVLAVSVLAAGTSGAAPVERDAWAGISGGCGAASKCVNHTGICTNGPICPPGASAEDCTGDERHGSNIGTQSCTGAPCTSCTTTDGKECFHFHECFYDAGCKARAASHGSTAAKGCTWS